MSITITAFNKEEKFEVLVDNNYSFPNSIHITNEGYPAGWFKGKVTLLHRYIIGAKKGEIVDHINGNKLDNRMCNLRIVSNKVNAINVKYKGYYFYKDKYRSEINIGKKRIRIGNFDTPEEAHEAYKRKHVEIHGELSPWKDEVNEYSQKVN